MLAKLARRCAAHRKDTLLQAKGRLTKLSTSSDNEGLVGSAANVPRAMLACTVLDVLAAPHKHFRCLWPQVRH